MQKGGRWVQIACKIAYVLNGRPLLLAFIFQVWINALSQVWINSPSCGDLSPAGNLVAIGLQLDIRIACKGLQQKFQHVEHFTCDPLIS